MCTAESNRELKWFGMVRLACERFLTVETGDIDSKLNFELGSRSDYSCPFILLQIKKFL